MNKSIHISSFPKIIFLASIIVFCFVFGFYTGTKSEQDNQIKNKIVEVSKPIEDGKFVEWKEYKNDDLGISFMYPAVCGEIKYDSQWATEAQKAYFTGGVFEGSFSVYSPDCHIRGFGGVTKNFSAGREGTGYEVVGFNPKKKNFTNALGFDALTYQDAPDLYKVCELCGIGGGHTRFEFNLKSSKFPAISFIGWSGDPQFMKIIDSVKIY